MEAGNKNNVILHLEDFEDLQELKDAEAGRLLKAIYSYVSTGEVVDNLGVQARTMFRYIRRRIDRDKASYEEKCRKRAAAGKLGGRPKKEMDNEENQEKAKKANGFFEKQNNPEYDPDPDPDPDPVERLGPGWQSRTASPIPPPDPQKAQEERLRRVKYLKTMLNLYHCGALVDPEEERRYRRELEDLTGGSL